MQSRTRVLTSVHHVHAVQVGHAGGNVPQAAQDGRLGAKEEGAGGAASMSRFASTNGVCQSLALVSVTVSMCGYHAGPCNWTSNCPPDLDAECCPARATLAWIVPLTIRGLLPSDRNFLACTWITSAPRSQYCRWQREGRQGASHHGNVPHGTPRCMRFGA